MLYRSCEPIRLLRESTRDEISYRLSQLGDVCPFCRNPLHFNTKAIRCIQCYWGLHFIGTHRRLGAISLHRVFASINIAYGTNPGYYCYFRRPSDGIEFKLEQANFTLAQVLNFMSIAGSH